MINVTSLDLSWFRVCNGKFLLYIGWEDFVVLSCGMIAYYELVVAKLYSDSAFVVSDDDVLWYK